MEQSWRPSRDGHAIERCSVSFTLSEPVPSKLWQAILDAADAAATRVGLKKRVDDVELTVGFGPLPANAMIQAAGLVPFPVPPPVVPTANSSIGRAFQDERDGVLREEIRLRRNMFIYNTFQYLGWSNVRAQIEDLLGASLKSALGSVNLQAVRFEYWDRFVFTGPPREADYKMLFQTGSTYVPRLPEDTTELWHSHVGAFIPGGSGSRRLVNVNIDVVDVLQPSGNPSVPEERRTAAVYTLGQDEFALGYSPGEPAQTLSVADELHIVLKGVLGRVIVPNMAQRIALTPGEQK